MPFVLFGMPYKSQFVAQFSYSNYTIKLVNNSTATLGLAVASGAMDYEALLEWVRVHRV